MSKEAQTIYVRVMPKKSVTEFYRCAMRFTDKWVQVEVDAATAKRLQEEQMLEVTTGKPADFEAAPAAPATAADDSKADEAKGDEQKTAGINVAKKK